MEGLLKQMFDNLFKLHGSFKMFKSLLLKEDGDGAFIAKLPGVSYSCSHVLLLILSLKIIEKWNSTGCMSYLLILCVWYCACERFCTRSVCCPLWFSLRDSFSDQGFKFRCAFKFCSFQETYQFSHHGARISFLENRKTKLWASVKESYE